MSPSLVSKFGLLFPSEYQRQRSRVRGDARHLDARQNDDDVSSDVDDVRLLRRRRPLEEGRRLGPAKDHRDAQEVRSRNEEGGPGKNFLLADGPLP